MAESLVPQQFNRPPGWRFAFGGLNLREVPDAVPVGKFPSVCNIRPTPTQGVQTRPGYAFLFACGNLSITDVGVYAALNTNNAPRYLARDTANNIYLDTGSLVAISAELPARACGCCHSDLVSLHNHGCTWQRRAAILRYCP